MKLYRLFLLFLTLSLQPVQAIAKQWSAESLLKFTQQTCRNWSQPDVSFAGINLDAAEKTAIDFRGRAVGSRYRLALEQDAIVELEVISPGGTVTRFVIKLFDDLNNPLLLLSLSSDCSLLVARKVQYNHHKQLISIVSLDKNLVQRGDPDVINQPVVFIDKTIGFPKQKGMKPIRVGMVDSGVNYSLPAINHRLARDSNGQLIGYDFWDMDDQPYDANLVTSGFFVQRHGTRTASLLLNEAPAIELVPYRYPRSDMTRMKVLIEHAEKNHVSIIGMPLGSNRKQDWTTFEAAARAHPQILFIVSAGNDGRDIDLQPVYPASLNLDNMLVVTSADDFVRPADRTNWGHKTVDYLIPAERVNSIDYSGDQVRVSGSSYAVSRMTALAARIKSSHPDWDTQQIIQEIYSRFSSSEGQVLNWVSTGYVADPLAGNSINKKPLAALNLKRPEKNGQLKLSIQILKLDKRWTQTIVETSVQQAIDILAQCDISFEDVSIHAIESSDYLKDLSTGSARTLLKDKSISYPTIVFARDTRMQAEYLGEAFGIGNTRNRPWLTNSVWLMWGVDDAGIALAHELYHVLANSGDHVVGSANLMQANTRPESVKLTADQCRIAQNMGKKNGLLR